MNNGDSYINALNKIISNLEELYGLNSTTNDGVLSELPIAEIVKSLNVSIKKIDKATLKNINISSDKETVTLCYLTKRLSFYGKKRLDFKKYPGMKTIARVLISFTKHKTLNEQTLRNINKVIAGLSEIDNKYLQCRNSLVYRYLRIFVVLVLHGSNCSTAIVADFLLNQMITREEL